MRRSWLNELVIKCVILLEGLCHDSIRQSLYCESCHIWMRRSWLNDSYHMCDITRMTQSWLDSSVTVMWVMSQMNVSFVTQWVSPRVCDITRMTQSWLDLLVPVLCIMMIRFNMWNIPVLYEGLIHTWHGHDSQYRDMTHSTVYHNDTCPHVFHMCGRTFLSRIMTLRYCESCRVWMSHSWRNESVIRRGKSSTNLSPSGRIEHLQNTTSFHNSGTMNLNSIRISTVRGHAPYKNPPRNTMAKSPGTNSNPLRISWSDTSFSPTDMRDIS